MSKANYIVRDNAGNIIDQRQVEMGADAQRFTNAQDIREKARQALDVNATFLALASPTNAQTLTQVQRLTRECSGIIRLLIDQLDTTDGT